VIFAVQHDVYRFASSFEAGGVVLPRCAFGDPMAEMRRKECNVEPRFLRRSTAQGVRRAVRTRLHLWSMDKRRWI
jgi:hypothetical protein